MSGVVMLELMLILVMPNLINFNSADKLFECFMLHYLIFFSHGTLQREVLDLFVKTRDNIIGIFAFYVDANLPVTPNT